ncbi:MAG: xylan 1,4-beta-xylosidase [Oscillospiraceae bacterium]|jgi:hypothetical protein|nr:xylan 1,4-beta-xylosidase [Oscillospiraceae bacterium]
MAKDRFVEVYNQGIVNVTRIIVDTETGVNYLMASHNKANGTGLTILVDQNGKPVVTPIKQ